MQKGHVLSEHSKSKGFAPIFIILAIIVAALIGGAYYLGTQKSKPIPQIFPPAPTETPVIDETTSWKTYTNKTFNYSVKYPSDWTIVNDSKRSTEPTTFSSPTDNILTNKPALVNIYVEDSLKLNLDKRLKDLWPYDSYEIRKEGGRTFIFTSGSYLEGENSSKEIIQLGKDVLSKMVSTLNVIDQASLKCDISDESLCQFINNVDPLITSSKGSQLADQVVPQEVTCLKSEEPFNPQPCKNLSEGQKTLGYHVSRNGSEGNVFTKEGLVNHLDSYLNKYGPFSYKGSVTKSDNGYVVYLDKKEDSLFALYVVKVGSSWELRNIIEGVATNDFINLEEILFDAFKFN